MWIFKFFLSALKMILITLLDAITGLFDTLLDFDSMQFWDMFDMELVGGNIANNIYRDVIIPLAVSIIFALLLYNLFKGFFGKNMSDTIEEPLPLIAKSTIVCFLVINCQKVLQIGIDYFLHFSQLIDVVNLDNFSFAEADSRLAFTDMFFSKGEGGFGNEETVTVCGIIVTIIFLWKLGWTYVKLIYNYIQRFVKYNLIEFCAPLGFSALVTKSTNDIGKRYIRLFTQSLFTLLLSKIMIRLYIIALSFTVTRTTLAELVIFFCMTSSLGAVFLQLEGYMNGIGFVSGVNNQQARRGMSALGFMGLMAGRTAMQTGMNKAFRGIGGAFASRKSGRGASGAGAVAGSVIHGKSATGGNGMSGKDAGAATASGGISGGGKAGSTQFSSGGKAGNLAANVMDAVNRLGAAKSNADMAANTNAMKALMPAGGMIGRDGTPLGKQNNIVRGFSAGPDGKINKNGTFEKDLKNGAWKQAGKNGHKPISKGDVSGMKAAPVAKTMGLDNKEQLHSELSNNIGKDGKAHGIMTNNDGSKNAVSMTPNGDDWKVQSGDRTFDSLDEAKESLGASSIDIFSGTPQSLDTSNSEAIGKSMDQACGLTDNISGFDHIAGMENMGAYNIVSMGNGSVDGFFADRSTGQITPFSGHTVDEKYALSHPESVVQMTNGQYMNIRTGSNDAETLTKAQMYTYDVNSGKFSSPYDDINHVDNHGKIVT